MAIRYCQAPCTPACPRPAAGRSDLCRIHLAWQAKGRPLTEPAPPVGRRVERAHTSAPAAHVLRTPSGRIARAIAYAVSVLEEPCCAVDATAAWERACVVYRVPKAERSSVPTEVLGAEGKRPSRHELLDELAHCRSGGEA